MTIMEGARRMQTAGKWIFLADCTFAICLVGVQAIGARYAGCLGAPFVFILPLLVQLTLLGVALWVAGWIVEGFAKETD